LAQQLEADDDDTRAKAFAELEAALRGHGRTADRQEHPGRATRCWRWALVEGDAPITLDEVQREPSLLTAVKRAIDQNRTAGRILLPGSANLSLMTALFASFERPSHLHGPFGRDQQPAEAGTIALVGGHLLGQGGEAAGAFVAGAGTRGRAAPQKAAAREAV